MCNNKKEFLKKEFWILSFGAAFQRAKIYRNNVGNKEKIIFKKSVTVIVEKIIDENYLTRKVDSLKHNKIIEELSQRISAEWGSILRNGRFRIGICQKLFNLYLKYLWCAGAIGEPPHCPVDRVMILQCPRLGNINWTEIDDIGAYKEIIDEFTDRAKNENLSLAEWELANYRRRNLK